MCSTGVVPLVRIKGIMRKVQYHTILVRNVIPGGVKLLGNGFILQQKNDPKHTAILSRRSKVRARSQTHFVSYKFQLKPFSGIIVNIRQQLRFKYETPL